MRAVRNALPGVIVPVRLDYALRALLSLSLASTERTKVDVIAADHGLSRKFLAHTLTALRDAGMVATRRGASGGYQLARPPTSITVTEVFDTISGTGPGAAVLPTSANQAAARSEAAWFRIEQVMRTGLGTLTIADLAAPTTPGRAPRR